MIKPTEPSVSGAAILGANTHIKRTAGFAAFDHALAALGPEDRAIYESALPVSWVPIRLADRFTVLVAENAGLDPVAMSGKVSRLSIEHQVRTLWRVLLRLTSDEALISRAPIIYGKTFSHGKLTASVNPPKTATIVLDDWPTISEVRIASVGGGIAAVLVAAGRKDLNMTSTKTTSGARFVATWT